MKKMIEDFKDEILETKDAIQMLKDLNKVGDEAKKCAEAKKVYPRECYVHIHGDIKPTKK